MSFTKNWYVGVPPFTGVAVNVTGWLAQTVVVCALFKVTLVNVFGVMVTVMVLLVAGFGVVHNDGSFTENVHLISLPLVNVLLVYVFKPTPDAT